METEYIRPQEIEKRSFEIIDRELKERGLVLPEGYDGIIKRVIHTTADFDYAKTLRFSPGAAEKAVRLIREGAHLLTDTRMAWSGINKKKLLSFGGEAHCFMDDGSVAKEAADRGLTRAYVSMERSLSLDKKIIYVIGNAPTALMALHKMLGDGRLVPELIIGVPVGFVNVVSSKELIMESGLDYIVNSGRKGGSNVAAAIVNALLLMAGSKL